MKRESVAILLNQQLPIIAKEIGIYIKHFNRTTFEITYNPNTNDFNLFMQFTKEEFKEYLDLKG